MTNSENIPVAAPEKWMSGWDTIYKKMLGQSDEELKEYDSPYMV
ncbi:MAG: hypothetical protein ACFFDR_06875 [Candidatus Thorarchaeota archaeon]